MFGLNEDFSAPTNDPLAECTRRAARKIAFKHGRGPIGIEQGLAPGTPSAGSAGTEMTLQEIERFSVCEQTIGENCKAFFALGEALLEIRDKRLYRESFKTFAEYCRVRWDFTRAWAHFQINASTIGRNLLTMVDMEDLSHPKNERQVRPLSALPAEMQGAGWRRAHEIAGNRPVTHHHVKQAVQALLSQNTGAKDQKPCVSRKKGSRNKPSESTRVTAARDEIRALVLNRAQGLSATERRMLGESLRLILIEVLEADGN